MRGRLLLLLAASLVICSGASSATRSATVRVLVVKETWGPQPVADVQSLTTPAAAFFATASFGTVAVSFTETPWVTAYADKTICFDVKRLLQESEAAAAPFDPGSYDRVVFATPCYLVLEGNDVAHEATVGLPASPATFEHELGHTFGISHDGALDCGSGTCTVNPYGNPFDVMGYGIGDFGALQKAEAGWPVNVETVTLPGTYRLAALEVPSTLPQALVVKRGASEIWIDHREPLGNDRSIRKSLFPEVTDGVLLHITPADPLHTAFVQRRPDYLLNNGGPKGFWLMRGKTFTVPHVLRLTIVKHVGTTVTVRLLPLR